MLVVRRLAWAVLVFGLLCFSLGCFVAAGSAWAEGTAVYAPPEGSPSEPPGEGAPSCPEPLAGYEGEDPAVAAEYSVSEGLFGLCRVVRFEEGRTQERVWWGVLQALSAEGREKEGVKLLGEIAEAPPSEAAGGSGVVDAVSAGTEAVESYGVHTLQAIYILIGVVLGMFVLSLLREILRRAG